ncbi:hypothetical protein ACQP3J_31035 [Escherichia coli]
MLSNLRARTEAQALTTKSILVTTMQDFIDDARKWERNNSGYFTDEQSLNLVERNTEEPKSKVNITCMNG